MVTGRVEVVVAVVDVDDVVEVVDVEVVEDVDVVVDVGAVQLSGHPPIAAQTSLSTGAVVSP